MGRPNRGGCYTVGMRRPTIRGTAKWGLTGAAVVVAALWPASYLRYGEWLSTGMRTCTFVVGGTVAITHVRSVEDFTDRYWHTGIEVGDAEMVQLLPALHRLVPHYGANQKLVFVLIPVWIPLALTALPAGLLWRADRRQRARAKFRGCPNCNYDRTGLAAHAPCPECGGAARGGGMRFSKRG
jgi:hypothetical protein